MPRERKGEKVKEEKMKEKELFTLPVWQFTAVVVAALVVASVLATEVIREHISPVVYQKVSIEDILSGRVDNGAYVEVSGIILWEDGGMRYPSFYVAEKDDNTRRIWLLFEKNIGTFIGNEIVVRGRVVGRWSDDVELPGIVVDGYTLKYTLVLLNPTIEVLVDKDAPDNVISKGAVVSLDQTNMLLLVFNLSEVTPIVSTSLNFQVVSRPKENVMLEICLVEDIMVSDSTTWRSLDNAILVALGIIAVEEEGPVSFDLSFLPTEIFTDNLQIAIRVQEGTSAVVRVATTDYRFKSAWPYLRVVLPA